MPVPSFTAPRFTEEDGRVEAETYTDDELDAAHRDVYGRPRSSSQQNGISSCDGPTAGTDHVVVAGPHATGPASLPATGDDDDGDGPPPPNNPSLLRRYEEALEALEAEEKEAYLRAVADVPSLVEDEAPPPRLPPGGRGRGRRRRVGGRRAVRQLLGAPVVAVR